MMRRARSDYAFPLRIDGGSQQAAQAPYAAHVEQMIEQILLTAPGERVEPAAVRLRAAPAACSRRLASSLDGHARAPGHAGARRSGSTA